MEWRTRLHRACGHEDADDTAHLKSDPIARLLLDFLDDADVEYAVGIGVEGVRLPGRAVRDNPRFVPTDIHRSPRFVHERVYPAVEP